MRLPNFDKTQKWRAGEGSRPINRGQHHGHHVHIQELLVIVWIVVVCDLALFISVVL